MGWQSVVTGIQGPFGHVRLRLIWIDGREGKISGPDLGLQRKLEEWKKTCPGSSGGSKDVGAMASMGAFGCSG